MFRLLQIELYKIKHNKASKVLITIYFGLLLSIALLVNVKFTIGDFNFNLAESGIFNFPYIWHLFTYFASGFKFFLLLVIVSMMANEYSNRTLKQNLIDGLSKKEFMLSKFYTVILLALISTLFVGVTALILGFIYSDFTEISIVFSDWDYLLAYFIKLVAFFSFGLFLGVLIKRSAFAVGAMLVWAVIEAISTGILKWAFKIEHYERITQFFPLNAMSNLIKEPITRFNGVKSVAQQLGEKIVKDFSVQGQDILIVLVWTSIFILGSYYLLKKRDL